MCGSVVSSSLSPGLQSCFAPFTIRYGPSPLAGTSQNSASSSILSANLCSFPLFKVITTTFRSSITWAEHFKCHLKRCFRFYRHLVAIRIQTLNTSRTFTSHAACLHPSRCLYSSIYFKVLCIKCIKPINSGYLFVFESNLFNCLWQLWQENRPDYFNMKLYVSQTDRIEVRVNHALLDAKISVHFSFPYFHHQIRN